MSKLYLLWPTLPLVFDSFHRSRIETSWDVSNHNMTYKIALKKKKKNSWVTLYPQMVGVFWNKSFGDRWSHFQCQWRFSGGCGCSSVFTRSLLVSWSGQSHTYCNWFEIWGVYFNVIRILIIGLIRSDCYVRMTLIKPGFSGKKKKQLGETGCKISQIDHRIADRSCTKFELPYIVKL